MTLEEAERAAGVALRDYQPSPEFDCVNWFPADGQGVIFLAVDGRLATIEVGSPTVTSDGIGAGATREDVIEAYGADRVEERTNRFAIRELAVTATDTELSDYGMVFLFAPMAGGSVEYIRAGLSRELQRDEGCV